MEKERIEDNLVQETTEIIQNQTYKSGRNLEKSEEKEGDLQ